MTSTASTTASTTGSAEHHLVASEASVTVGTIDRDREPRLTIASGDVLVTSTLNHWADGIDPTSTLADAIRLRTELYGDLGPHSITGPVEVLGSRAGQVLRVDILDLQPRRHGYTLCYPAAMGFGLLADDFPEGFLRHYELDLDRQVAELCPGVEIPLRPFLGIMGVAPPDAGSRSSVPPGRFGGNIDLAELVAGTTLHLPIWQDGANFFVGDAHAAQGNGEVCLTAIETAMDVARLRLTVWDGFGLAEPWAETANAIITMGFDVDLRVAAETATRNMIRLLGHEYGLPPDAAYALCSVAGDLSVTQVVNQRAGVHCTVRRSLFTDALGATAATAATGQSDHQSTTK